MTLAHEFTPDISYMQNMGLCYSQGSWGQQSGLMRNSDLLDSSLVCGFLPLEGAPSPSQGESVFRGLLVTWK